VSKAKTLSELEKDLEKDLEKLLEASRQETSANKKSTLSNCIHAAEQSLQKKSQRPASRKLLAERSSRKTLFQTSMILMNRSNSVSRKLKTLSTSTLLSKNSQTSGLLTLLSWNKINPSSHISKNWTNQFLKTN